MKIVQAGGKSAVAVEEEEVRKKNLALSFIRSVNLKITY